MEKGKQFVNNKRGRMQVKHIWKIIWYRVKDLEGPTFYLETVNTPLSLW
jgi:hypothetical protein